MCCSLCGGHHSVAYCPIPRLDRIVELLEQLVGVQENAAEQAELATHRSGCKCGRC